MASFIKPESAGKIALRILKNQQEALLGDGKPNSKTNSIHNENVTGNVINTAGSKNTTVILAGNSSLKNEDDETQKIMRMFDSEIARMEKNLNSIPDVSEIPIESRYQQMVNYAVEQYKKGNPQYFQNTPVYAQYSKEMMQFNDELREMLIEFYEFIQAIHRNADFNFVPGTNDKIFQIQAYFDNAKKARELIPKIKILLKNELN